MTRKRFSILLAFFGILVVISPVVVGIRMAGGTEASVKAVKVRLEELLAEKNELPTNAFTRVQFRDTLRLPRPYYFGAIGYGHREWGQREGDFLISELVLEYPNKDAAAAEYFLAPYGRVFNDDNFLDFAQSANLSKENLHAKRATAACLGFRALERKSNCPHWTFRGQYGQYLVEITFSKWRDPQWKQGLDEATFLFVVKVIDRHISKLSID